ncbi:Histidine triad (HIT) protein [Penicillium coprophilum]|uniref:Histidine triad (HIT) protein n=1 Tax=Penicillium coprophilum TaxID=36646 RepID=UPI00238995DF|nr:Histidine triad (HIT) protein [Penicillium coprophilum]KAJ5173671.1 Histidine triad (HIT) protein [Penicillium coprophilum]
MSALKGATAPIYFGPFIVTPQVNRPLTETIPNNLKTTPTTPDQRILTQRICLTNDSFHPQVFHTTPLTFALVNLKPILPGHVLVSPRRVVPRVADLTPAETSDLFLTVRRVGRMVERVYSATSLNIAVQDGAHAGQSVPHVHAHIIPRKAADLDHAGGTDAVYDLLDGDEGDLGKAFKNAVPTEGGCQSNGAVNSGRRSRFPVVDNDARKPREEEDMRAEADMLAREMENEPLD